MSQPSKGLEGRYRRVVKEMRDTALEHRRLMPKKDVDFLGGEYGSESYEDIWYQ